MTDSQATPIRFADVHGVNHLALHGVVDLFVAAELHELALQCTKSGRAMVVDCRCLERIDGSYTNVVGLPVALVCDLLMRYPDGW